MQAKKRKEDEILNCGCTNNVSQSMILWIIVVQCDLVYCIMFRLTVN